MLKRLLQSVKYPIKMTDDSEIPESKSYVILDMDSGFYFLGNKTLWVSNPRNAKVYRHGDGLEMHKTLYALRKKMYRVTTTNEQMGWR